MLQRVACMVQRPVYKNVFLTQLPLLLWQTFPKSQSLHCLKAQHYLFINHCFSHPPYHSENKLLYKYMHFHSCWGDYLPAIWSCKVTQVTVAYNLPIVFFYIS